MKIFNFTDGHQGNQVGTGSANLATGGWFCGDHKITLANPPRVGDDAQTWQWSASAHRADDSQVTPGEFGDDVQAICFCLGQWGAGDEPKAWTWHVLGTPDWNRQAVKNKILHAEKRC